jgi:2-keto-4-pentenoate hydratase
MALKKNDREKIAEQLFQARRSGKTIPLVSTKYRGMTMRDAYLIQFRLIELQEASGGKLVGMKVGFSNPRVQKQFGVSEPLFGHLVSPLKGLSQDSVNFEDFAQPMVEPEVAFVLGRCLKGPGINEASVMAATKGIVPALELVDMRYRGPGFKATDAAADNIFSSGVVLGSGFNSPVGLDLSTLGLVLEKNGEVIDTAAGAAVLGNPALSVAWLANKLAQFDRQLYEGQVIISGSFTGACPVKKGDAMRARFSLIGDVSIKFT